MQILDVEEAVSIATEISKAISGILTENVDVFIAPSFNALYSVGQAIKGTKLKLCGQNMYFREKGAFTGEISPDSLIDAGCEYVLLGHSERRRIFGESDAVINQKVKKALEKGLKPVLCIGETAKEKENGQTETVIQTQIEESLADIPREQSLLLRAKTRNQRRYLRFTRRLERADQGDEAGGGIAQARSGTIQGARRIREVRLGPRQGDSRAAAQRRKTCRAAQAGSIRAS